MQPQWSKAGFFPAGGSGGAEMTARATSTPNSSRSHYHESPMSFYSAFLVSVACGALHIALTGFAVFVWLKVLIGLEERRAIKRRQRESRF
jgi:hypothetical protein